MLARQLRLALTSVPCCCAPAPPRPLQHGAQLALVELHARDQQAWAQRIEQRGAVDRGTEHEHKPGNWSEVQAIQARNGGSEAWSAAAGVRLHCTLDSTALSTQQLEEAVLAWLAGTGLLATTARRGGGGA